jgi:ABC-2 type transport system ATP-binding protein
MWQHPSWEKAASVVFLRIAWIVVYFHAFYDESGSLETPAVFGERPPFTGKRGTFAVPSVSTSAMVDSASAPVLQARGLAKRYGAVMAVRDIDFSIRAGQILGVLGPNGSGKSTIVRMVTGLLEPTFGGVLFHGERIDGSQLSGFKRHLGYVPEQPDLYGFLTGWEYLDLVATLRGLDRRRFAEKAGAMLDGFTLYPHRDTPIASYSKGMRQRIVLIAALMHDPELLVLDEPFSGLDLSSALVVRRVIALLAAKGKAIFFSSPVLEQVEKLCSHLVVLKKGSVVASGAIEEVSAGFAGLDLEAGFMQLTEQVDADRMAQNILSAVAA